MDKEQKVEIAQEYKRFWETSKDLTKEDIELHPLEKKERFWDRQSRHLIGMLEMYGIRYGDPEERFRVVDFLEKQIFGEGPTLRDISSLSLGTWGKLRHTILSGEYKDLSEEAR